MPPPPSMSVRPVKGGGDLIGIPPPSSIPPPVAVRQVGPPVIKSSIVRPPLVQASVGIGM